MKQTMQDMVDFEERVQLLLDHAKTLQRHIEAHEFSLAALEAQALALYCEGANMWANRLADNEAKGAQP